MSECLKLSSGVRFVQLLAPVSLFCVICSILACYAGGLEKTLNPEAGQRICMIENHLLQAKSKPRPYFIPLTLTCFSFHLSLLSFQSLLNFI